MPHMLYLNEFGSQVWAAFGEPPYHVGSSLHGKKWRDVDVRLMLDDSKYDAMFGPESYKSEHTCDKWVALCMAFSELGRKMTGLPVDFQIQRCTQANEKYPHARSALGITPLRINRMTKA